MHMGTYTVYTCAHIYTQTLALHGPWCVCPTFTRNCINNKNSNKMIIWLLLSWPESLKEKAVAVWRKMTWKTQGGVLANLEVLLKISLNFEDFLIFKDSTDLKGDTHIQSISQCLLAPAIMQGCSCWLRVTLCALTSVQTQLTAFVTFTHQATSYFCHLSCRSVYQNRKSVEIRKFALVIGVKWFSWHCPP